MLAAHTQLLLLLFLFRKVTFLTHLQLNKKHLFLLLFETNRIDAKGNVERTTDDQKIALCGVSESKKIEAGKIKAGIMKLSSKYEKIFFYGTAQLKNERTNV